MPSEKLTEKLDDKPATDSSVDGPKTMRIMAPGSCVKCGDIPAKIISVTLRDGGLWVYQVAWWAGNERRIEGVGECELTATDETKFIQVRGE
jgi:hypothetical protein